MISRAAQITNRKEVRILWRTVDPNLAKWNGTGELKTLTNRQAVIQSVKNLVDTYPTERYYHLDIGCMASRLLFEFADQFNADRLAQEIRQTMVNYEPRASNPQIVVTPFPEQQYFNVDISFTLAATGEIVNIPTIVYRVR